MKKIFSIISAIIMITSIIAHQVLAASQVNATVEIITMEDGSFLTVELTTTSSRAANTKTGTKTYTYHAADGTVEWKGMVTGTFEYNGSSSTCTVSVCTVTITNKNWYVISKSSSKSGNTAYGYITMGRDFLGVRVDTENLTIALACDKNGKLS